MGTERFMSDIVLESPGQVKAQRRFGMDRRDEAAVAIPQGADAQRVQHPARMVPLSNGRHSSMCR